MRIINPAALATLAAGRAVSRLLLIFDLPSGTYGFWDGIGLLTYAGRDYVGAGKLLAIDDLELSGGLAPAPVTLQLSAMPEAGLTVDVLATIEDEQYHQRPCTMSRAYFDPDTRALISVERIYRGYIDQIEHAEQVGGGAALVCSLESRSRDHTRVGHRVRGDADQRRIAADDGFFRHAATAGTQKIIWGRRA